MPFFQAENLTVDVEGDLALLKLDVPGRSVNVFTPGVLRDLDAALDRLAARGNLRALVIRSSKKAGFVAGADIAQFAAIRTTQEAEALSASGQQLFDKLALLPVSSLAILHGACLGAGLELALACDYRLIVDVPGTQLGLPEVELGLLPGWGGTQRLPRIIGLERALQVILAGKRLSALEAYQWGLADSLTRSEEEQRTLLPGLLDRLRSQGKRLRSGLPLRTWRQRLLESTFPGRALLLRVARKQVAKRAWDDMPAPGEALAAVRTGLKQGMSAGLAFERQSAARLAVTPACRNLVNLFLEREKARKPAGIAGDPVKRIGIVGAGVMGAGIAQLAALRGCEVLVREVSVEALGLGIVRIRDLFRKAVERGLVSPVEADRRLNAIKGRTDWDGFDCVDLVVESVAEDALVKKAIFQELEQRMKPRTVLATNTSSLLVASLQEGAIHPERIAGLHFFNPVHKMDLVEVVQGPATGEAAMKLLMRFGLALGKTPMRVKDSPGFVVNRILMPYLNEAVLLVAEGQNLEDVDSLMRRFGMALGPLQVLDQVGLDVAAHIARAVEPLLGERYAPHPAFRRLSESGWLGVKAGAGFYRYRGKKAKVNRDALAYLRQEPPPSAALVLGLPRDVRRQQARERLVLLMVNEAAACLGAGLVASAQDLDLALVLGTGWAPHQGGPLHFADAFGLARAVERLTDLARQFGARYKPSEELQRRAAEGRVFYSPGEPGASAPGV